MRSATGTRNDASNPSNSEIGCVVIPVDGAQLLLPNVCVAEIMPWRRIKVAENEPAWCMGYAGWRGQVLPVLNYAGFSNPTERAMSARCLIVMNRSRHANGHAFYALAAEGLPRMMQLVGDDLQRSGEPKGPADAMCVAMGAEQAIIPNLDFIERSVAQIIAEKLHAKR